ncbi:MAG: 1-aminocyclopropane-1-carboxylate deaminase/D-cysteine desulfhydrase [Candidatus Binatia bacterium]
MTDADDRRPLFARFPGLAAGLPWIRLATLPTPVRRMAKLGDRVGPSALWLKDDGPSSAFYGGNKVRKLELVLGAARARHAARVLTFGYAGSNHAAATAVHASRVGMRSISILLPQPNASYLRKNLLVSAAVGAELHEYPSRAALYAGTVLTILKHAVRDRKLPFLIAPGGSSPLGTVSFVNAAFELAEQVDAGLLPLPEKIYVAAGSLGTVVGLGIGLAALGLPVGVVAVRVVDEQYVNPTTASALWRNTLALLRGCDAAFPDVGEAGDRISFRGEFFGGEYAGATTEAVEAQRLAGKLEALDLDITYTAKALACLLTDARASRLPQGPVLFWNTRNSSDLSDLAEGASPGELPRRLRRYFEPGEVLAGH